jgi:hypothetical protein
MTRPRVRGARECERAQRKQQRAPVVMLEWDEMPFPAAPDRMPSSGARKPVDALSEGRPRLVAVKSAGSLSFLPHLGTSRRARIRNLSLPALTHAR